jgi:hypothetical protein
MRLRSAWFVWGVARGVDGIKHVCHTHDCDFFYHVHSFLMGPAPQPGVECSCAPPAPHVRADMVGAQAVLETFDVNGDGVVDFSEFLLVMFNRRELVRKWKSLEKLEGTRGLPARTPLFSGTPAVSLCGCLPGISSGLNRGAVSDAAAAVWYAEPGHVTGPEASSMMRAARWGKSLLLWAWLLLNAVFLLCAVFLFCF